MSSFVTLPYCPAQVVKRYTKQALMFDNRSSQSLVRAIQSYMMDVTMGHYVHSEKYGSNIKMMYQNSYSLNVAIKTAAWQ